MAQGFRPDRLADQIRSEISELLAREVHDPGVGFITVTRVQVTTDLQIAHIYYTTMADEAARKQTTKALARVLPFLRRQLAGRLRLRRVPELDFRFDRSVEHQDRVERLIHEIQEERAARTEDPSTDEPQSEPE
ncbi:MAG: 30S ribosome-binding factor RbfA [Vicinamibacterales bacterium]|nr:30S ribosome-binding factor RbfA [Vicinamibacterales bacterium]